MSDEYDWGVSPEQIRAYLDDRDVSDEQRAIEAKKRAILGSLDDTYALNRHERGHADPFWLYVGATGVALGALTLVEPRLLLVLFGYLALALPFAVWMGGRIARGGRR